MIDIPIGKALVPVEGAACKGCIFDNRGCLNMACRADSRADGKTVIFKLVDWPAKEEQE
jgi:hypothetical protein